MHSDPEVTQPDNTVTPNALEVAANDQSATKLHPIAAAVNALIHRVRDLEFIAKKHIPIALKSLKVELEEIKNTLATLPIAIVS